MSMALSYLPVSIRISFHSPAIADMPPLFVLRSMLGRELRSMCCLARQNSCPSCMYARSCTYSFLFETILPQDNDAVPRRDRGSHPFAFTGGSFAVGKSLNDYEFTTTLFGKAADYLPYIYAAFVRAGKCGIFKSRTKFSVTAVCVDNKSILLGEDSIDTSVPPKVWNCNRPLRPRTGAILVELRSPLRFKHGGTYGSGFSARDFMGCLYRRMRTLCLLYGPASDDGFPAQETSDLLSITDRNLRWEENRHWSSRQQKAMSLGGLTGSFRLEGTFSAQEQELLEFARIAGTGKNTNFGLGQLDFWARWE